MNRVLVAAISYGVLAWASASRLAAFRSLRCSDGTLPTPTYGLDGALFTVCSEQLISAPVWKVYEALIDFRQYHVWNSFVIEVDLPSGVEHPADVYIGMPMNFTTQGLIPGVNTTSMEQVTVLSPHSHFAVNAWRANDNLNGSFVKAEHPNILTAVGHDLTRYVSYETYYLPTALVLLPLQSNLKKEFDQQGVDLKRYVEGLV